MDKKVFIICLALIIAGCQTRSHRNKQETMDGSFEKFDIQGYINKNLNAKQGDDDPNDFTLADGTRITRSGDNSSGYSEEQILAKPHFYKIMKEFYPSGFIMSKGQMFGTLNPGVYGVKIGTWYYFDPQGNQEKVVNEDEKFGSFGYKELLKVLQKDGLINIHTGKNRDAINAFFEENEDGSKIWSVEVTTEHFSNDHDKGWKYLIDATTGKVLEKNKFYTTIGEY